MLRVGIGVMALVVGSAGCGGQGPQGPQGEQGPKGDPGEPGGIGAVVVLESTTQVTLNTPTLTGGVAVRAVEGNVAVSEEAYLWVNADIHLTTADRNSKGACWVSMPDGDMSGTFGDDHRWEFFAPAAGYNQLDLSFNAALSAPIAAGTYTIYAACAKDADSDTPVVRAERAVLTVMVARARD
jgi:hypothetical protein